MMYTFHLRTVTEVFSGGADIQNAELRPSAFRGPLRFWFRAMMGSIVGNDLVRLKHLEALVFGATDISSPFILRLADLPAPTLADTLPPTPPSVGKSYLGFSMYSRSNEQIRLARGCIPAGQNFTLSLRFKRPDQKLQDVVLGSLWLLTNFGGIGARSRRGFGTLAVRSFKLNGKTGFNYFAPHEADRSAQQLYRIGFALVVRQFKEFAEHTLGATIALPVQTAEYANFTGWTARLIARENSPAGPEAGHHWFREWGIILRSFRNGTLVAPDQENAVAELGVTTPDYRRVVSWSMDGNDPNRDYLENDVLGLPLGFQSRTRQGPNAKRMLSWRGPDRDRDGRRASPLFLHPVLLSDGRLATLAIFFISRFLPDGAEIPIQCPSGRSLDTATVKEIKNTASQFFDYVEDVYKPRQGRVGDLLLALP